MFAGRTRELATLRNRYASNSFEFIGIYGRRRVGKTALVSEFTHGLRCGWCAAVEEDAQLNLRLLSQAVYTLANPDADPLLAPSFTTFADAVEAAFAATRQSRGVLVIDEFPYLAKASPSFPSILQAAIDAHQNDSRLMLILCGSSLSFMKEQLFDRESPLYGRRTGQIELKPFDFFEAQAFFPHWDVETRAQAYGLVGGTPLYLKQLDDTLTLSQNIAQAFLDPSSLLFEEPYNLLKQEVSKVGPYQAVIAAIAQGAAQHNEIATKAHLESAAATYYLNELQRIGLVEREEPIAGRGGRKGIWKLTDNLFRFWYRFVQPRRALIERGMGEMAAPRIEQALPEYLGPVFEEICRQWLWRQAGKGALPFDITNVGRWWGNDPAARSKAEIDIVAVDEDATTLVAECKWTNAPFGADQLAELDRRAHLASASRTCPRWAFSKTGFSPAAHDLAAQLSAARLIDFAEMCASA